MMFSLKKASQKNENDKKSKKKSKKSVKKTKRIAQNSIDYEAMIENGICYLGDDLYSGAMKFTDVNYQIARQEDQEAIWSKYMELLNSLGSESGIQLVIHNHEVDNEDFRKDVLMKHQEDGWDNDRDNFNAITQKHITKGNNNIVTDKMFVYTTVNEDLDEAKKDIEYLNREFSDKFKELGCTTEVMDGKSRLEQMYLMFNPVGKFLFDYQRVNDTFTTKDAVTPTSFDFSPDDYFMIEDRYCRVLWLKNYSTEMSDRFINDLTRIEHNLVISFNMKSVARGEEIPMIKTNIAGMELQKMEEQRKALKEGYDPEMIPMELKYSLESAEELLNDVQRMNQRLFICQFFIMINCETKQELKDITKLITTKAKKHSTEMVTLNCQQEACMNACLPLGKSTVYAGAGGDGRTLTTPVCGAMIPFTSQELMQKGQSFYYGLNPTTNNLIFADRKQLPNASGWCLAKPGSGKSFAVKREILQIYLNTQDDIICIDPENEYDWLCEHFKGADVKVDSQNGVFFNPLEGDIKDSVFLSEKAEFMQTMMAQVLGYDDLEPQQKSIIDRTLRVMYANYEQKINDRTNGLKVEMPTLDDFVDLLEKDENKVAQDMALALGIYTKNGTYNLFSKPSNVDPNNRFTVYDIKELSEGLKRLGMLVILETLWTRIKKNFKAGKRTWVMIDEIYLLFNNDYCINFFYTLWKRARKYGAILTGITQNVEDLLHHEKIRTMLANSNFIIMLDQAPTDRDELASLLNLSNQMMSSITNAKPGSGLLLCGNAIIPFRDEFDKTNPLYEFLTSDFEERTAIRKQRELNKHN